MGNKVSMMLTCRIKRSTTLSRSGTGIRRHATSLYAGATISITSILHVGSQATISDSQRTLQPSSVHKSSSKMLHLFYRWTRLHSLRLHTHSLLLLILRLRLHTFERITQLNHQT